MLRMLKWSLVVYVAKRVLVENFGDPDTAKPSKGKRSS